MGAFFINLINAVIKGIGKAIAVIIGLFPDSPFSSPSSPPGSVELGYITWVLDFPTWLTHLTVLLSCIAVYYVVRIAARWIKAVRS